MAKPKEKHPVEHYKAIIRKQTKTIRELQKQAGRGNKIKAHYEDMEAELAEQFLEEEAKEKLAYVDNKACPECADGRLEEIPLGVRKIITCTCGYRKIVKV